MRCMSKLASCQVSQLHAHLVQLFVKLCASMLCILCMTDSMTSVCANNSMNGSLPARNAPSYSLFCFAWACGTGGSCSLCKQANAHCQHILTVMPVAHNTVNVLINKHCLQSSCQQACLNSPANSKPLFNALCTEAMHAARDQASILNHPCHSAQMLDQHTA